MGWDPKSARGEGEGLCMITYGSRALKSDMPSMCKFQQHDVKILGVVPELWVTTPLDSSSSLNLESA